MAGNYPRRLRRDVSWIGLAASTEVLDKHLRDDGQLAVTVRADPDKAARVRAKFAG
jgi:hypothetical protein